MINEIKTIIKNYLNNAKLTSLMIGTVVNDGVKISDKLTIPNELIKGNLKDFVKTGDKVRLIRNHGGQEFYIVEILGIPNVLNTMTVKIEPITVTNGMTISNIKIKGVSR
ncbi:hypothetical protein SAMN02745135_02005 [Caloranaerobacter azorensis DSM 13643]|uniref:Uncharacterized protein n=1 Tax=Caloranaerobacter azorensis DSM 13643 TaxID=1121264 RepID=A0A1M5VMF8_9FIRM|nr:DNA helicase [Caloranaerobacter azorensis]SHH76234.1 hypothetical protein SAMN02745135_02005 [Caloranaerobacter azorensis DSM 13643]